MGLTGAELESTARAILRSQPNDYLAALDYSDSVLPLRAICRPMRSAVETGLVYELNIGDSLAVKRDRDSRLNRNAVFLSAGDRRLGYLQADAARAIGPEIDAGQHAVASVVEIHIGEGDSTEITVDVISG